MASKEQSQDRKKANQHGLQRQIQNLKTPGQQEHLAAIIQQAGLEPRALPPDDILQLQQTVGNSGVVSLLGGTAHLSPSPSDRDNIQYQQMEVSSAQARLTAGPADDEHEQEADRAAEQAINITTAGGQTPDICRQPAEQEELQAKPSTVPFIPILQRQSTEEKGDLLPKKSRAAITPRVAWRQAGYGGIEDRGFENRLSSTKGRGAPLPPAIQPRLGPKSGTDFTGMLAPDIRLDGTGHQSIKAAQRQLIQNDGKVIQREKVEGGELSTSKQDFPRETHKKGEVKVQLRNKLWKTIDKITNTSWKKYFEGKPRTLSVNYVDFEVEAGTLERDSKHIFFRRAGKKTVTEFSPTEEKSKDSTLPESVKWNMEGTKISKIDAKEKGHPYEVSIFISIKPTESPPGCEQIGFLQVEKAETPEGKSLHKTASKEQEERKTESNFAIDRTEGASTPFYGLESEKGSYRGKTHEDKVWDSQKSDEPATMRDKPTWSKTWHADFETYVICIKGKARGTVYGLFRWGFKADEDGKVKLTVEEPKFEPGKSSEDLREASGKYNEQVAKRRTEGQEVEAIPVLK